MAEESRAGELLASKYRLGELLGSGGMGHVYRAVNEDIGRVVAIKVLRKEHVANAHFVERFFREAKAANLVRHPNVVDVLDIGRDADGSPFIVQELLDGEDLAAYLDAHDGRLSLAEVEDILLPVIDAVAEAHAHGVVHRDLKPENVFLAKQGKRRVPKLLDFGISKLQIGSTRMTEVGMMMGTPAYMPPEQVHGTHEADPRSDVWALGTMLFEVIAGRLPFHDMEAPRLFVAIATRDAPKLADVMRDVTSDVSRVVDRCLRREPDDRYPSALELARDLRHVFAGSEIEPTQMRSLPPPARPPFDVPFDVPDLVVMPKAPSVPKIPARGVGTVPERPPARLEIAVPRRVAVAVAVAVAAAPEPLRSPRVAADAAMSSLTSLAAVSGIAIVALVVAMTVGHQPGGFAIVGLITTPTLVTSLIVQGGLALVAALVGASSFRQSRERWRGEVAGGRVSAAIAAAFAGALFFVAIELVRGAF